MKHYFVKFPETKHQRWPYYGLKTIFMYKLKNTGKKWDYYLHDQDDTIFYWKRDKYTPLGRIFVLVRSIFKVHSNYFDKLKIPEKC
jgi:hypothetical protein